MPFKKGKSRATLLLSCLYNLYVEFVSRDEALSGTLLIQGRLSFADRNKLRLSSKKRLA